MTTASQRTRRNKYLAMLLVIAMLCTLLPISAFAADSAITATTAADLQTAFNNIADNGTITIGNDFNLNGATITHSRAQTIKLDLNGHTISYTAPNPRASAFTLTGTANLTIQDSSTDKSGEISITGPTAGHGITNNGTGTVTLENGTINQQSNQASYSAYAINNNSTGTITMTGGKIISGVGSSALYQLKAGAIHITGGMVEQTTTGLGAALALYAGTCNISGGTIKAIGASANAIWTEGTTVKVYISGDAVITSACSRSDRGTLTAYVGTSTDTIFNITGGTIRNTATPEGYAVYNTNGAQTAVTGGTVGKISPSSVTITGTIQGSDTSAGIPATLQLKKSDGTNAGAKVNANADGTYSIPCPYRGEDFTIEVSHTGYTPGTIAAFDCYGNVTGKDLTLQKMAGPFVAVTNLKDVPTATTTGSALTLSGTVEPATATNKTITWSIKDAGTTNATLSGSQLSATTAGTVVVTATVANGTAAGTNYTQDFSITVTAPAAPSITTTSLPNGTVGSAYSHKLEATGSAPISWSLDSGNLPAGLSLSSDLISGTPTTAGSLQFTVKATNSAGTTAQALTLTINEKSTGGGSTGGSGGGGGSSSKDSLTSGTVDATVKVDSSGTASVTVTETAVKDAIKAAQEEAKKNGFLGKMIAVEVKVKTDQSADQIKGTLPKAVQETLVDSNVDSLAIVSDQVTLSFHRNALQRINNQANADVTITAAKASNSALIGEAKSLIGNRPLYDFTATYGSSKITDFGTNNVTITVPYTLTGNETAVNIKAVYVDDNGKATVLKDSKYDAAKKAVVFTTSHFSSYGVGYEATAKAGLTDISGHWAQKYIEQAIAKGWMTGTTATTFEPNTAVTRAMAATVLYKMADSPAVTGGTSFGDVSSSAWYAKAITWAADKGIMAGMGNDTFAPNQQITREQLAVVLYQYAKSTGKDTSKQADLSTYADQGKIAPWATEAMTWANGVGLITGKSVNTLDPKGQATRAELATMLVKYSEMK